MFIIGKILTTLLNPLLWVFILLFIGYKKKKKYYYKLALFTGLLFSNAFLQNEIWILWEKNNETYLKTEKYDLAVVLGGYASKRGERVNFHEDAGRYIEGIRVIQNKNAKRILLSGGSGSITNNTDKEASILYDHLGSLGIPQKSILLDSLSRNTYENAINASVIIKEAKLQKVVVITSAYHCYRAKKCFNKQGIYPDMLPVSYLTKDSRNYTASSFIIPKAKSMHRWQILFKEWFGIAYYKISGKL